MKIIIVSLITILGSGPFVFANWQEWTVWKSNQASENSISGTVKTIAINDESDQLIVKIRQSDGSIAVAKFCHEGIQSAKNQVHGSVKLDLLRGAMASGQKVNLSFSSNYDHCIQGIQVDNTSTRGVKKAAATNDGFQDI